MSKKRGLTHLAAVIAICLLVVSLTGCGRGQEKPQAEAPEKESEVEQEGPNFITVGGGAAAWAVMAAKIADVISSDLQGVSATSIPGGGIENLKKIQTGEIQFGMTHSPLAGWAYEGKPPFDGQPITKARHVMTLYKGVFQAVTPKNSGLTKWEDLKNKPFRVNVNKAGTWGNFGTLKVLEAYGITEQDIISAGGVVNRLGYDDATTMMQDGLLDLWITADGIIPHSSILELERNPGIRFLEISKEVQDKLTATVPGVEPSTIPKGSYATLDKDIPSIEVWVQLVAGEDVPEKTVYDVTAALAAHIEELKTLFKGAEAISLETALAARALPVHPGAKKFYEEKGIKVEE